MRGDRLEKIVSFKDLMLDFRDRKFYLSGLQRSITYLYDHMLFIEDRSFCPTLMGSLSRILVMT